MPKPKSQEEIISLILSYGKVEHIAPTNSFWNRARELGLPESPSLSFSDEDKLKLRVAYLLHLIRTTSTPPVTTHGPSPMRTDRGICLSTLYFSFITGTLGQVVDDKPGEHYQWRLNDKLIRDNVYPNHDLLHPSRYSEAGITSALINEVFGFANGTFQAYITASQVPNTFFYDFNTITHFLTPIEDLEAILEEKWNSFPSTPLIHQDPVIEQVYTEQAVREQAIPKEPTTIKRGVVDTEQTPDYNYTPPTTTLKSSRIKSNRTFDDEYEAPNIPSIPTKEDYLTDPTGSKLVIGDLVFIVPPSAISFSTDTQSVALPTVRTSSSPVLTTNATSPRANMTLFFNGTESINNLLRPLFAMYRNAPFTTIQNKLLHKNFLGRRMDSSGKNEISDAEYFLIPVPIVLESLSVHTVAGYPNSMQADLSVSLFNNTPYSPAGLEFLRTTDMAIKQAYYSTRRNSRAFHTIHVDQTDNDLAVGNAIYADSSGKTVSSKPPSVPSTFRTNYPAESWPFIKAYRSSLADFKSYPGMVNENARWTKYTSSGTDLTFRYHSTMALDIPRFRIERQLAAFDQIQNTLNLMYQVLTDPTMRDEYFLAKNRIGKVKTKFQRAVDYAFGDVANVKTSFEFFSAKISEHWDRLQRLGELGSMNNLDLDLNITFLKDEIDTPKKLTDTVTEFVNYLSILDLTMVNSLSNSSTQADPKKVFPVKDITNSRGEVIGERKDIPPEAIKILRDLSNDLVEGLSRELNEIVTPEFDDITPYTLSLRELSSTTTVPTESITESLGIFNATVTGISVSYRNNIVGMPILGHHRPTYQHIGGSNARVIINLRTESENLLKYLTDLKESSITISRLLRSGEQDLLNLARIEIEHEWLKSFGLQHFALSSLSTETIAGSPGWYECNLELIQNDFKLTDYESFQLVLNPSIANEVWEFFCPLRGIKFPTKQEAEQIITDTVQRNRNALKDPSQGGKYSYAIQRDRPVYEGAAETYSTHIAKNYVLDKNELVDVNITRGDYIQANSGRSAAGFLIRIVDVSTGARNQNKTDLYYEILRPYITRATAILKYIIERNIDGSGGTTITSLQRQYEAIVLKYIRMLIQNLSSLAEARPQEILEGNIAKLIVPSFIEDDTSNFASIQGYFLNQARLRDLTVFFRRGDFQEFLDQLIKDRPASIIQTDEEFSTLTEFREHLASHKKELDKTIGTTYPDLPIPPFIMEGEDINHKLLGPAFYAYLDFDFNEYKSMSTLINTFHSSISLQLAMIRGSLTLAEYNELNQSLTDSLTNTIVDLKDKLPDYLFDDAGNIDLDGTFNSFLDYQNAMLAGYELGGQVHFDSVADLKDLAKDYPDLIVPWKGTLMVTDKAAGKLIDATPEVTEKQFSKVMVAAALLRYFTFVTVLATALDIKGTIIDVEVKKETNDKNEDYYSIQFIRSDNNGKSEVLKPVPLADAAKRLFKQSDSSDTLNIYGGISSTMGSSANINEDRSQEARLYQNIAQMKRDLQLILTQSDSSHHASLLGIADIDSDKKRFELGQKLKAEFESSSTIGLGRAFPTFKLFFIEENASNLLLFDDFYSYDAVHSIDIVDSKHAASSTAIIRLSNVTNKLTGIDIASLYKEGASLDLPSMYLKPGTPIILRMGYGSDYRELPIVFQGAITGVQPGSVVEITAQSWGVQLTERLGSHKELVYSSSSAVTTIGGVIMDILDRTPGLRHFGRWQSRGIGTSTDILTGPQVGKIITAARSPIMSWLIGLGGDFLGKESTAESLRALLNGRSPSHLFLNIGNPLYDNLYVNGTDTKSYGRFSLLFGFIDPSNTFDWIINNKTAWEALNEVCLHLGDYIVRPLPYNEGTNQHVQAPRYTLYIGPREGVYKCTDPSVSYESFENLIQSQADLLFTELKDLALDEKDPSLSLVTRLLDSQMKTITDHMHRILSNSWGRVNPRIAATRILEVLKVQYSYKNLYKLTVSTMDSLLDDHSVKQFVQSHDQEGIWVIIAYLLSGGDHTLARRFLNSYSYTSSLNKTSIDSLAKQKSYIVSTTYYGTSLPISFSDKLRDLNYNSKYNATIKRDLAEDVIPRILGANIDSSAASTVENKIRHALVKLGAAAGNIFRPTVEHHFANSYQHIVANEIVATADRMYNSVELLYPKEPGKPASNSYRAFISYDLDPNYVRTYQSFQSNIDSNVIFDYGQANRSVTYNDQNSLPSHVPIAHQILANVMRPMYQGQLTLLGNTSIRPYHIVHIYDDVNSMSGPVEVEEVIHSFSPTNGFTTTIVPNLVIYNRSMGAYVDQAYIETLGRLRMNRSIYKSLASITGLALMGAAVRSGAKYISKKAAAKLSETQVKKSVGTILSKGAGFSTALPALFGLYTVGKGAATFFNTWMHQTIGMAEIIAGHNPLIFVPLTYNGRPYTAGMEGIGSYNKSLSTVLVGKVQDASGNPLSNPHPIVTPILSNDPKEVS